MTAISGNTYPVKDQLRALGGKWNPDAKAWMVPDDKADQAKALVAGAPASNPGEKKPYRPTRCKQCGCAASRYNKIYRNGICGNCYRDNQDDD